MYTQNKNRLSIIVTIVSFLVIFLSSAVQAADVTLTWTKPNDDRVVGYHIYSVVSGTGFTSTPVQTINSADQTSCLILNLEEGQTYNFTATSFDLQGNESDFSETISYAVPVTIPIDNDGDGFATVDGDCNDNDASIYPGAIEICGDGIDQDCNGSDLACSGGASDIILQSQMRIFYVDSEEINNYGYAFYAIDGNENTIWHTEWYASTPVCPHEIVIDLGGIYDVQGLRYLPRQNGSENGMIADYEIYVSQDGSTWNEPVTSGTWIANLDEKEVLFSGKIGQYVRLVALSEVNGNPWSSAAEINILGSETSGNEVVDGDGDGYKESDGDCNDSDASIHPDAVEICGDGIDQDCNGSDLTCPEDIDNDGDGFTENQGDCNDSDASIYPGAAEICGDGVDQNCDGSDLICPENIDNDGDGYTENQGDCNDNDSSIYPGAPETCGDGIDQDCNGSDLTCPEDIDNDGDGFTENQGDCNDSDASIYPGAAEICGDGVDQNCDGSDLICPENIDNDGDGYTENQGDCNDNDSSIYPGAPETCGDGIDQDCNGSDLTCPEDIDNDGDGFTENQGDCNDSDASIYPGAAEICGDGVDQNCDGSDLICPENIDNDGDGYTENQGDCNDNDSSIYPGAPETCGDGIDQDCNGSDLTCPEDIDNDGDGFTENQGDCNDSDASIYPGAAEICGDGVDQNCDGSDLICPENIDKDGDGFTENQGDCNDSDSTIYPGAIEICGDGIDQDCNGSDMGCTPDPAEVDDDGDGYTENDGDCDDIDATIFPGAIEICGDGIDQDCNGSDLACSGGAPDIILQSQMRIFYVDSEEINNYGYAFYAIDGNENTIWHTEWYASTPVCPHEIVIDLGGIYDVQGLRYLPRQNGSENGMIADYEIYVSQDGSTWNEPVTSGTWIANLDEKEVLFSGKIGQYVRLVALSEVNGNPWSSAAEINILGSETSGNEVVDGDGDGYKESDGDCNDSDASIHPDAVEICGDGIDQDCNGSDLTCPEDIDNDGDGFTENQGDCNDSDASIYPGAAEICGDGVDQNCDGSDLICPENIDNDGDGYTENQGDCNDNDASIHPNAAEICGDGIDQDCNGRDLVCPEDIDKDGDGFTENEGDCNDSDRTVFPGAIEICGDGIDQDCDGSDLECIREDIPGFVMEIGEAEVNHDWQFVPFTKAYLDPVVVAKPISLNGEQPAVIRINNVTPEGFEIRVQEWDYLDGYHAYETVGYMVMEAGHHVLTTGIHVEAGTIESNSVRKTVNFNATFNQIPVLVSGVTTENETDAVTGRLDDVTLNGFDSMLQEEESHKNGHYADETVSYIAWEPSSGEVDGMSYIVDSTFNEVTHKFSNISFYPVFNNAPVFVADMQTTNGGDTANVRWQNKTGEGVDVQIDEEQSQNPEVNHVSEVVGYMAFSPMQ